MDLVKSAQIKQAVVPEVYTFQRNPRALMRRVVAYYGKHVKSIYRMPKPYTYLHQNGILSNASNLVFPIRVHNKPILIQFHNGGCDTVFGTFLFRQLHLLPHVVMSKCREKLQSHNLQLFSI